MRCRLATGADQWGQREQPPGLFPAAGRGDHPALCCDQPGQQAALPWPADVGKCAVDRFVVALVTTGPTKTAIEHKHPQLSASALSTVTDITVVAGAVAALIGVAAFIWIARLCLRGRHWARITVTVLAGLGVLGAAKRPEF